jgi:predicted RNase H-like nuclease
MLCFYISDSTHAAQPDYISAKQCRIQIEKKGLSKQAWAIVPKIIEVDDLVNSRLQETIFEGHPEISFTIMNNGLPVPRSKHKQKGRDARLNLLKSYFPGVSKSVACDAEFAIDIIDAYALL